MVRRHLVGVIRIARRSGRRPARDRATRSVAPRFHHRNKFNCT